MGFQDSRDLCARHGPPVLGIRSGVDAARVESGHRRAEHGQAHGRRKPVGGLQQLRQSLGGSQLGEKQQAAAGVSIRVSAGWHVSGGRKPDGREGRAEFVNEPSCLQQQEIGSQERPGSEEPDNRRLGRQVRLETATEDAEEQRPLSQSTKQPD